jgi:hypothetical protein
MSDTRCGARREPANNFDEAARCDLRAGHTGYHRQLSPWQECWPQDVPVPSETGARREEGLSELSEDVAQALSDMQRESRGVGEVGFRPGREMAEREERRARDEAEAEILSLLRAALHRARVAEEHCEAMQRAVGFVRFPEEQGNRYPAPRTAVREIERLGEELAATRQQVETLGHWTEQLEAYWPLYLEDPENESARHFIGAALIGLRRALLAASPPSSQPTEPAE